MSLLSFPTLVQPGGTEHNLQSLVRSGDTDLKLKSVCSQPVFMRAEKLHNNCHLEEHWPLARHDESYEDLPFLFWQ